MVRRVNRNYAKISGIFLGGWAVIARAKGFEAAGERIGWRRASDAF
jgi:hypothetical protein